MGTKRPFNDVDSRNADDKADMPGNVKRQRQLGKGKHRAKQGNNEFSKKRARNIQRLLQRRQDLPANVFNDLKRELEVHKAGVADKAFQRQRSAMIAKYHMVRFFGTASTPCLLASLHSMANQMLTPRAAKGFPACQATQASNPRGPLIGRRRPPEARPTYRRGRRSLHALLSPPDALYQPLWEHAVGENGRRRG